MSWSKDFGRLPFYGFKTKALASLEESKASLEAQNPGCIRQVEDVIEMAYRAVADGVIGDVDRDREVTFSASGHYSADNNQVNSFSLHMSNQPKAKLP